VGFFAAGFAVAFIFFAVAFVVFFTAMLMLLFFRWPSLLALRLLYI
jgi:hypothetical protein